MLPIWRLSKPSWRGIFFKHKESVRERNITSKMQKLCSGHLAADSLLDVKLRHSSLKTVCCACCSLNDCPPGIALGPSQSKNNSLHIPFLLYKVQYKNVTMLLQVKYQNTKKYIGLISGFTFLDFIAQGELPSHRFPHNQYTRIYVFGMAVSFFNLDINFQSWCINENM